MNATDRAASTSRRTNGFHVETETERDNRIANRVANSIILAPLELTRHWRPSATIPRQSPLPAQPPHLLSSRLSPAAASVFWQPQTRDEARQRLLMR
jgi:hypothetical protein